MELFVLVPGSVTVLLKLFLTIVGLVKSSCTYVIGKDISSVRSASIPLII